MPLQVSSQAATEHKEVDRTKQTVDPNTVAHVRWRESDVVTSAAGKTGTTWLMNVALQLLRHGTADFDCILHEVHWADWVEYPGQPREEQLARWDALPTDEARIFKTHFAPPVLPLAPGVKYVVAVRDPRPACLSFWRFLHGHSDDFWRLWGHVDEEGNVRPPHYGNSFDDYARHNFLLHREHWRFIQGWWPHRHAPNVCMVHYEELRRQPEEQIRRIAAFLGWQVPPERWPVVLEHCSFAWMKANQHKFENNHITRTGPGGPFIKVVQHGCMIRSGGRPNPDDEALWTPELLAAFDAVDAEELTPEQAAYVRRGGPLP